MKRILLFDIDGTLTKYNYIRGRNPLLDALSTVYGTNIEKKEGVYFSGGTERSIVRDVLVSNGIKYGDTPTEWEKIFPLYAQMLGQAVENGDLKFELLPNVLNLLHACELNENFDLALVTGNLSECAELKLTSAGINANLFKKQIDGKSVLMGGFGNDDINRPGLVKAAINRFENFYDSKISPEQFLVIGDTPKDIHCAHANGVGGVGVATGIFDYDALLTVSDAVLQDFSNLENSVKTLLETTMKNFCDLDYSIPPTVTE